MQGGLVCEEFGWRAQVPIPWFAACASSLFNCGAQAEKWRLGVEVSGGVTHSGFPEPVVKV